MKWDDEAAADEDEFDDMDEDDRGEFEKIRVVSLTSMGRRTSIDAIS